jgi:hypothetical protein
MSTWHFQRKSESGTRNSLRRFASVPVSSAFDARLRPITPSRAGLVGMTLRIIASRCVQRTIEKFIGLEWSPSRRDTQHSDTGGSG